MNNTNTLALRAALEQADTKKDVEQVCTELINMIRQSFVKPFVGHTLISEIAMLQSDFLYNCYGNDGPELRRDVKGKILKKIEEFEKLLVGSIANLHAKTSDIANSHEETEQTEQTARVVLLKGDITKLHVDAIVNAANRGLRQGSGVCGAIYAAAGAELNKETDRIGPIPIGSAVSTGAYDLLNVKRIIHAVGPVWNINNSPDAPLCLEDGFLRLAYEDSLQIAERENLHSIAFPCISTGVYGYPKKRAANIAISAVMRHLFGQSSIRQVIFACFEEDNYLIYTDLLKNIIKIR